MLTAIYARKSTEQNGVAEEAKSVTRQVEHARAYAERKGWAVADEYVYCDDGISGAEFVKRPGLIRLMNALKPRPPFGALIVTDRDRIGREQIETSYVLKQLLTGGVRVFECQGEGREITLASPTDKIILAVQDFAAEVEREKARTRTYDALARKARNGHVTGGKVFGYDNIEVRDAEGRRAHVMRRVNDEQAVVVRRIFALYAEGTGFARIAKILNDEGLPPRRRAHGWAPIAIREILLQPLYCGKVVWGRVRKRDQWGVERYVDRPREEWLEVAAPHLSIVSADLWRAAHVRLARVRAAYAGGGRPALDRPHEKYLLSGIAKCGVCGGSLMAFADKRSQHRFYGCMWHNKRGASICRNPLLIRQERLDRVVLDALAEALDERLLDRAVEKALARLRRAPGRDKDRRAKVHAELALVEARMRTLVDEIKRGYATDTLRAELGAEETRKRVLSAELEALAARRGDVGSLDAERLRRELRRHVADLRPALGRPIPQTRQILRRLLVGRLVCEPFETDGRRGYRFTGRASYESLMPTALASPLVDTPTG